MITNSRYILSHIDVLMSDDDLDDNNLSDSSEEFNTRDGGSTPGPWEDVHRRMACLATTAPLTSLGSLGESKDDDSDEMEVEATDTAATAMPRKRKRKEKQRRWVWTIGVEGEEEEDAGKQAGAISALRAADAF